MAVSPLPSGPWHAAHFVLKSVSLPLCARAGNAHEQISARPTAAVMEKKEDSFSFHNILHLNFSRRRSAKRASPDSLGNFSVPTRPAQRCSRLRDIRSSPSTLFLSIASQNGNRFRRTVGSMWSFGTAIPLAESIQVRLASLTYTRLGSDCHKPERERRCLPSLAPALWQQADLRRGVPPFRERRSGRFEFRFALLTMSHSVSLSR